MARAEDFVVKRLNRQLTPYWPEVIVVSVENSGIALEEQGTCGLDAAVKVKFFDPQAGYEIPVWFALSDVMFIN